VQQTFAGAAADVEVTAFRNDYDDLIVAVGPAFADSSRFRTDNISNARAQGIEAGGGWRLGALALRASYTFIDTTILAVAGASSAPPPFSVGDALIRRPRHQGRADVTWTMDRVQAFASAGARGQSLDIEPNFGAFGGLFDLPGFTRIDAGLRVRVHRFVDLFARVTNMLDRSYEETLGFRAPGRLGVAGVRVAVGP
jgi:outer membrane cobalamin receptor